MKTYFTVPMAALALAWTPLLWGAGKDQTKDSANTSDGSKKELLVYSARQEHLIQPIFKKFEEKTGMKVTYITDDAGVLLEKLKAEGEQTKADLLLTVDAGNLWQAAQEGLLDPVQSESLNRDIPSHLRDPEGRWFGLSVRARTLVFNTEKVKPSDLSTYEDLASPRWKGRLCLRTSKKVYNQSLVAMLISAHGEKKTQEIVEGWVANLAAPVFADDTAVIKAVASGQCHVGIVNTYYFGRYLRSHPNATAKLFWPNQKTKDEKSAGVHVNVSGAGLINYSKNRANAIRLLEWLAGPEAQHEFAALNLEYPANPKVENDPAIESWGNFRANQMNLSVAGRNQANAIRLMDRAHYK